MNREAVLQAAGPSRSVCVDRAGTARLIAEARRIRRLVRISTAFAFAALDFLIFARWNNLEKRTQWMNRWCRVAAAILGMAIERRGSAPRTGLIVANHISYLDIVALAAVTPCLFVAKCEVARWPVLGAFASMAGTVFIDRSRRRDVVRVNSELARLLGLGLPVVLFPEGTSSDGRDVLPFKTSLFQPVTGGVVPVAAVAVDYTVAGHSVPDTVSYWGDMTLIPHLLKLLTVRRLCARVAFGNSELRSSPRKETAIQLRRDVVKLRREAIQTGCR